MMERLKCVPVIEQSKSGHHQYGTIRLFTDIQYNPCASI